jgi:hypothetical protein
VYKRQVNEYIANKNNERDDPFDLGEADITLGNTISLIAKTEHDISSYIKDKCSEIHEATGLTVETIGVDIVPTESTANGLTTYSYYPSVDIKTDAGI